jgi:hypothetical protein
MRNNSLVKKWFTDVVKNGNEDKKPNRKLYGNLNTMLTSMATVIQLQECGVNCIAGYNWVFPITSAVEIREEKLYFCINYP